MCEETYRIGEVAPGRVWIPLSGEENDQSILLCLCVCGTVAAWTAWGRSRRTLPNLITELEVTLFPALRRPLRVLREEVE
ncbi:hypothetical protein DL93DRAFT_552609 [Clavulina sp. PMI_390]|nr:hypothetical protein DL93DRAFT_552609 [Clavulina sp. PMI_390]